jgi:ABC-type lipoprotein export system ATPase subunit
LNQVFSGQRRVARAFQVALQAPRPRLLDTKSSSTVQDILLDQACKHNRAVVFVSHDMAFVKRADWTITIIDGSIVAS